MNTLPTVKPPKYLVCVDSESESQVALRLACAKAAARAGTVNIIHVIPPADFQTLHAVADRMRAEQLAEAQALTARLAQEVLAHCGFTPGILLREGPIGEEILAAANEDVDATMMVLGVAEHHASRGKLTGWLATQLGTKLFIPLLLVPGNLTDQQLEAVI